MKKGRNQKNKQSTVRKQREVESYNDGSGFQKPQVSEITFPEEMITFFRQQLETTERIEKKRRDEKYQKRMSVMQIFLSIIEIIVVGVLSTLLLVHSNQLQEQELVLSKLNQQPSFKIDAIYENESITGREIITGFKIGNTGGSVEHVDVKLESMIHLNLKPFATEEWEEMIIPYSASSMFFANDDYPMIVKVAQNGTLISSIDNHVDIGELSDFLDSLPLMYLMRQLNILTLTYTDFNRIRHEEKYVLFALENDSGHVDLTEDPVDNLYSTFISDVMQDKRYYLYYIDEKTEKMIEDLIPDVINYTRSGSYLTDLTLPVESFEYMEESTIVSLGPISLFGNDVLMSNVKEYIESFALGNE